MANPATILIVDDDEINRMILSDFISNLGHTSISAENGLSAMAQMKENTPDIVLLDIVMPAMDGYEVLERMKNDSNLRHIPVIMITSIDEMDSVAQCIESGADDYLTKPFNPTLLKARVNASLEKKQLRDKEESYRRQIEDYNLNLEKQVRERTKELAEAHERLTILDEAKSDFLTLISHELRTPLTGIVASSDLMFNISPDDEKLGELQEVFQNGIHRLITIVEHALLLTENQSSDEMPKPISVKAALEESVELASEFAKHNGVLLGDVSEYDSQVIGDEYLLTKALSALLETAVKFSIEDNVVSISCDHSEGEVSININAIGRQIPEDALPNFFEVLSIFDSITPGGDLGLGPPVAERLIKLLGGSVSVENQVPPGIVFTVKLQPVAKPPVSDNNTKEEEKRRGISNLFRRQKRG